MLFCIGLSLFFGIWYADWLTPSLSVVYAMSWWSIFVIVAGLTLACWLVNWYIFIGLSNKSFSFGSIWNQITLMYYLLSAFSVQAAASLSKSSLSQTTRTTRHSQIASTSSQVYTAASVVVVASCSSCSNCTSVSVVVAVFVVTAVSSLFLLLLFSYQCKLIPVSVICHVLWNVDFVLLVAVMRYRDIVDNTVRENSGVFCLIWMRWLSSTRACGQ